MKNKSPAQRRNEFANSKPFEFAALHEGRNPRGIRLRAEPSGRCGEYQEIAIRVFRRRRAVADLVVGLDASGELRVLTTTGSNGDGDHRYVLRPDGPEEDLFRSA